jgi:hypothetical protein
MAGSTLHITLARSFADEGARYRVLVHPVADDSSANDASGREVGFIELNRRIELQGGAAFFIERRGNFFAPRYELVPAAEAQRKAPAVAVLQRERVGLWWQRVLITQAAPDQRYLLHRRGVFGSPANADVLSSLPASSVIDLTKMPVVLHVEKSGAWRQRLQARWLDSTSLSLPVVLFVLNVLADQDRRAAIAASAGVAGV